MPVLNYTPDNTPPTAIVLPSQTPTNVAPVAVALSSMAGTGAAPVAIPFASQTPNNAAPVGVTLSGFTPDNTPPVAVAFASMAGTAAQPVAIAMASQVPNNAAPVAVTLPSVTPDNTPPVAITLPNTTPSNGAPVAIPLPSAVGTSETPRPIGYVPPLAPLVDDNVNTPILQIEGALVLNTTYGQTRTANASALTRLQFSLQDAPVGGPATITLVDGAGVSYGVSVTINDGEVFGETILNTPLALPAGSNVRAKATVVGLTSPGGFGNVTLFTNLTS
jgi:hypothetical protein